MIIYNDIDQTIIIREPSKFRSNMYLETTLDFNHNMISTYLIETKIAENEGDDA